MAEAPIWPVATDAFIADTTHLDAEQTGAYLMLLMSLWRSPDAKLPMDDKKLCRMARVAPRRWPSVWSVIADFFTVNGEFVEQKRVSSDRVKVREKMNANRANGERGGRPKVLKNNEPHKANGSVSVSEDKTQNEPKQNLSINHEPYKEERDSSSSITDSMPRDAAADASLGNQAPDPPKPPPGPSWDVIGFRILRIAGLEDRPWPVPVSPVRDWLARGWTEENIMAGVKVVVERPGYTPPKNLKYFEGAIAEVAAAASNERLAYARTFTSDFTERRWTEYLAEWSKGLPWPEAVIGPAPNEPGTLVWPELLERYRTKFGNLNPQSHPEEHAA